jgi:uncharacterized RDD family membrane protein YckC
MTDEVQVENKPAGFWVRAAAQIIDAGIVLACMAIPTIVLAAFLALGSLVWSELDGGFFCGILGAPIFLCHLLYFAFATRLGGRTAGKGIMNIKVVRISGQPVGFSRSVGRYLSYFLSALPLFAGFVMAGVTREKRALHDYIAGTKVVSMGVPKPIFKFIAIGAILFALFIAYDEARYLQRIKKKPEWTAEGLTAYVKGRVPIGTSNVAVEKFLEQETGEKTPLKQDGMIGGYFEEEYQVIPLIYGKRTWVIGFDFKHGKLKRITNAQIEHVLP